MTTHNRIPQIAIAVSVLTVMLLIWSIFLTIEQPHVGATWSRSSGLVQVANPDSLLQVGDVVVAVADEPVAQSGFPFFEWEAGDTVSIVFRRDGLMQRGEMLFSAENNTLRFLLPALLTTFIAGAFWCVSLFVLQLRYTPRQQLYPFFFAWQLLAIILAFGNLAAPIWLATLTLSLMWFITPAIIHLHLRFPVDLFTPRIEKFVYAGYLVAAVSAILTLVRDYYPLPFLTIWYYIWLTIGIFGVLGLLVRAYFRPLTSNQRRQLGILGLSSAIALVPFLSFVTLPQILLGQEIVMVDLTIIPMVVVPIGYGYALARYRVNRLERYLSRATSLGITLLTAANIYLLTSAFIAGQPAITSSAGSLLNLLLVLLIGFLFTPFYKRLRYIFDNLFYGGQYDYSSVISPISKTLIESSQVRQLADELPAQLQKAMRVRDVAVVLPDFEGKHCTVGVVGNISADLSQLLFALPDSTDFWQQRPHFRDEFAADLPLDEHVQLFVPIRGLYDKLGLLLLGSKFRNDGFGAIDIEILTIVAHQASITFQNLQLIERLKQKISEADRYQRQMINMRDEERKRIARDLHDNIIQELVGFRYTLSNPDIAEMHLSDSLLEIIQGTRQLCYDLRPPALDFGLIPAVRSLISRFEAKVDTTYQLRVAGLRDMSVRENVMIGLFYCVQEALTNIYKHAQAELVQIHVDFRPNMIHLHIDDDGVGFALPERLGNLMTDKHFGLVGMRERIELIDGTFEVFSAHGTGTSLHICVPNWQADSTAIGCQSTASQLVGKESIE